MRKSFRWILQVLAVVIVGALIANSALAGIAITGDVAPSNSADWNSSTDAIVGETAAGSVEVNAGDDLFSNHSYVGGWVDGSGTTSGAGTLTVTGPGSTWTAQSLMVGCTNGVLGCKGTLYIQNGGRVDVLEGLGLSVGWTPGSATGEVYVDGSNSVLDVDGHIGVGGILSGTLSVTAGGAVTSARGTIKKDSVVTVDGNGSTLETSEKFYVGYDTGGTLNVTNHSAVSMGSLYVGYNNSTGLVQFGANGGTLNTKSLWSTTPSSQFAGTGKLVTHGIVTDANLSFDSSHGATQTLSGFGSINATIDVSDSNSVGDLGVGYAGTGTLRIADGLTVYSASGYLGNLSSTTRGTATVDNATWNLSGDLAIGYNRGRGILDIQNGCVSVAGKTTVGDSFGTNAGTVTMSGGTLNTQSLWTGVGKLQGSGVVNARGLVSDVHLTFDASHGLTQSVLVGTFPVNLNMSDSDDVGDLGVGFWGSMSSGTGTLRIADGVAVTSQNGMIATQTGTFGTATVDGASWNVKSRLAVGVWGYGALSVRNGASVQCDIGEFGSACQGTVTVDGPGSTLDVNSKCWISGDGGIVFRGDATINITNGGVFTTPDDHLQIDGPHEITVDGSGSTWNIGQSIISWTGMIAISNGGVLNTGGDVDVYGVGISLNDAKVKATGNCSWYYHQWQQGSVKIGSQGATFDSNSYDLGFNLALADDASVTGHLSKVGAGTVTLAPVCRIGSDGDGNSIMGFATSTYTGLTTVQAGQLTLGGKGPDELGAWNPVLNLGGADIQAGKLVFDYTGGTSPADAIAQILHDSYGTADHFAQANGAQIYSSTAQAADKALGWMDDGSQVTVMYTLYGDSNLDGSVNGTDLNAVLSYYNQSSQIWNHGDFNYDGSVNGTDLNTVLSNYNQSLSSSTAAVPEPSTLLLMVLGLLGLLVWRQRK